LAACIVMENESRTAFEALLAQHLDRLQPADALEFGFIEEMAAAYWRMRRAWALETRILENHAKAQPPGDEIDRMAAAFTDPAAHPGLGLMHRYETRLHCIYQRALHNFLLLRAAVPNEIAWPGNLATPGDENSPLQRHRTFNNLRVFSEEPNPISEHPDDLVELSSADE
jgi:hypothetical protein